MEEWGGDVNERWRLSWEEGKWMTGDKVTWKNGVERYTTDEGMSWEEGKWMTGDRVTHRIRQ